MKNEEQKKFIENLIDGGMIDNIFGYAYKRCFSEYEAEDLCQEIIAEILLALQKNSGEITNINAYIWQIAHNTYINHVKKQKRTQANYYSLHPSVNNYGMEDDILERIVDAENLSRIKLEIAALPEIYKNVMIMHYFDGLSVAEIAGSLGIPENNVKQRLFAAREKIKKEVNPMGEKQIKQTKKVNQQKDSSKLGETILNILVDLMQNRLVGIGENPEHASLYVKILIDVMIKKGIYINEMKNWDVDSVVSASRIHDIGKLAIPDIILSKPGELTQEEAEIMRGHTSKGEEILNTIIFSSGETQLLNHAKLFIRSHHERWNGEGHPNKLKGEEIPLEGRIMAVADVYETLVSERPYKAALTCKEAEDFIKNNAGIIFDPLIVDVFDDDDIKKEFAEIAMQLTP